MEAASRPSDRGEELLRSAWSQGSGLRGWLTAVNHKNIGLRFIVTGLVFLLIGGVLALLMRTQLAVPNNEFLSVEAYNEIFSMHGTVMMFLFAVPILEGLGMYLLPLILGTRDLPFPRLNAFGYFAYLFGGLFVFAGWFLFGEANDTGWFAYTPLSGPTHSPTEGMDFWLLGVTLVEISGLIGAVELLTAFLSRRAPGMSLSRIPVFAWGIFVMAAMIVVAFAVLVAASVMLEMDRKLSTRFFDPSAGGAPLLWQHLFWFFGHPEVYIMLIPGVAAISTIVPVFARRSLAGYPYVVAALIAIGILSFGLWVHHMFTTGLSLVGLSFFAAVSFLIAIPSGVQVFAWLATLWRGRPSFRSPLLFALGFLVVFVAGGVTGVMVAAVPFDWQAHDSYFVVAHFHYVLIGGVVFPVFAALYYWFPKWTGRLMSERLGQASFWTMLVGFNVAFFPQHIIGLEGMPRRIFTYDSVEAWGVGNLVSTIGAFLFATGVLITIFNLLRSLRAGAPAGADPWGAGGLEWSADSPPAPYNYRELPVVESLDPLWHSKVQATGTTADAIRDLAEPEREVRGVLETSAVDATPLGITHLPGPSWWPISLAVTIVVALAAALADLTPVIAGSVAVAAAIMIAWAYLAPAEVVEQAREHALPLNRAGAGWWGTVFACVILGSIVGAVAFSYVYLAVENPVWPIEGAGEPPLWPALAVAGLLTGAYVVIRAGARSALGGTGRLMLAGGVTASFLAAAALGYAISEIGASPTGSAYGSAAHAALGLALCLAVLLAAVVGVTTARVVSGAVDSTHRVAPRLTEALAAFVAPAAVLLAVIALVGPRI